MSSVIVDGWNARLKEFNARNVARLVDLEVIREDLGTQPEALSLPLVGIDYDTRDERIEIMLGAADAHLTHTIGRITAVDILRASPMHGDILRIQHDGGQTILSVPASPGSCSI